MPEKDKLAEFEEMLGASFRCGMQDLYLDLFLTWMAVGHTRTVRAQDLADQKVKGVRKQRRVMRHNARVGYKSLLEGLFEKGVATADHDMYDVRTYRLTLAGLDMVTRLRDIILKSKDRPVTGDWHLNMF
jgi:hypothetical protein